MSTTLITNRYEDYKEQLKLPISEIEISYHLQSIDGEVKEYKKSIGELFVREANGKVRKVKSFKDYLEARKKIIKIGDVEYKGAIFSDPKAKQHIGDEVEITGGAQLAQLNLGLTGQQLGDDGGNNRTLALTGTVGVEGTNDGHRQIEAAVEAFGQTVGTNLGGRVGALALIRMLLVDGNIQGGAVHLAGGGDHHALGVQLAGGVQHVQGALDVGVYIAVGAVVAEGDGNQSGQMVHMLLTAHCGAHTVGVTHVAGEDLNLAANLLGQGVDPAQLTKRVVQAEGGYLFAGLDQLLGEVTANETIGAGDHYFMGHSLFSFQKQQLLAVAAVILFLWQGTIGRTTPILSIII